MSADSNDLPDITTELDSSPLGDLLTEFHEVYEGLISAGFMQEDAARIIAYMLGDAITSRGVEFDDEDEDEDDDSGLI